MHTSVDRFGRVLIPKTIRDHLGFKPGDTLDIEEKNHMVVIKIKEEVSPLKNKQGLTVHTGKPTSNIEQAVSEHRHKRLKDLRGFK